jgi:hypothetical protein
LYGQGYFRQQMNVQASESDMQFYTADVITTRPASDYPIRIIPDYKGIAMPLENNLIL